MVKRAVFALSFAPEVMSHLDEIERKPHGLIRQTIQAQLRYTPTRETRNRKPTEQSTTWGATWELRFGPKNCFRVFYEVDEAEHTVWILAIGVKEGARLFIAGKEIDL
jgi:mRNA-degrading endonuclease RelE of RelBE toxin-antitoxin system